MGSMEKPEGPAPHAGSLSCSGYFHARDANDRVWCASGRFRKAGDYGINPPG
jgi:hypothetical protein